MEGTDKAVLIIGQEDWPFPIPLVRKDSTWRFDTAAGREESHPHDMTITKEAPNYRR